MKTQSLLLLRALCLGAACLAAPAALADAKPAARHDLVVETQGINTRFLLQNHFGQAVTDGDFAGRYMLIAFGFTFCPDVCPTTLSEMASVLALLGDQAKEVQPLFITVDPTRDTLKVLREYTAVFDKRILGLRGSPELTARIAEHYKVRYQKVQEPGQEHYTMDHSAGVFLVGPKGEFLNRFAYGATAQEIAQRIRTHIAENPKEAAATPDAAPRNGK